METKEEYTQYKIILLGDSGVGKTAIINRYCKELFSEDNDPTIGVNFQPKFIEVNGKTIKLAIWDTAGQEKFRTITRQFYRKVDGAILVYDISDRKTLDDLEQIWIPELNANVSQGCQLMLVGNKSDLKDDPEFKDRIVPKEDGEDVARKNATLFVEASAKNSYGVKNLFEELVQRLVAMPARNDDDEENQVSIDPNPSPISQCSYC